LIRTAGVAADGLVVIGYSKHFRVNHSDNQFADGTNHINGIKSFWSSAKQGMQKFNGVSKRTFFLHLKESEYGFNNRRQNLFRLLLKLLENNLL
jgi:transposase-like protein